MLVAFVDYGSAVLGTVGLLARRYLTPHPGHNLHQLDDAVCVPGWGFCFSGESNFLEKMTQTPHKTSRYVVNKKTASKLEAR